jgi:hypothetical protein
MALKKSFLTSFGVNVPDAYHRVHNVRLITKESMNFSVQTSVDGVLPEFSDIQYFCDYAINGENPIKQAYEYLKTLPQFEGAIDC